MTDVLEARARPRVCLSACVYEPDASHRRLRQMLDSAVDAGTTDFAIAVDRKSAPGTADWVRRHLRRRRGLLASVFRPARVAEFDWQDDFAHARNVALDLVPTGCDWWYAIDADDRLECADGTRLPEYMGRVPPDVKVVRIPYVVPHENGKPREVMVYETFFRGPVAYRWERAWGEELEPIDRTRTLQSTAFQRVHDQDQSIPRTRCRNLRVMRRAVAERPDDPVCWAFLAQCHSGRWEFAEAIDCFRKAVDLTADPREKYGYNISGAYHLLNSGWTDEVLRFTFAARAVQPQYPESYIHEGRARLDRGEFAEAVAAIEAGLARMDTVADPFQRQHAPTLGNPTYPYEVEPFEVLALAYSQLGRIDEALASVERALAANTSPSNERAFVAWRESLLRGEAPQVEVGRDYVELVLATNALIDDLRAYDSLDDIRRDLDDENSALSRHVKTADVLTNWVVAFLESYFGKPLAGDA